MVKLDEEGAKFLAHAEGTVLNVYNDVAGIPTVCTGHVVRPEDKDWLADGVTMDECLLVLQRDVRRFERCVEKACARVELHPLMADALISLAFNIGEAAFETSSVVRYLNQRNRPAAAEAFLMWRFASVKMENGTYVKKPVLLGRRMAERAMFVMGCYSLIEGMGSPVGPAARAVETMTMVDDAHNGILFDLRNLVNDDGSERLRPELQDGKMVLLPPTEEERFVA
jgi:lysozyme